MIRSLHLFEAFGIELEYMIVDKDTLEVKAIADELLRSVAGKLVDDHENGLVTWSNELVLHLIELKCTKPEKDLDQLEESFRINVRQINKELLRWNAMLLPSAAHPLMDPSNDTKLWPHGHGDIYARYNEMFDCKGHGWSNLQSTHLNLPFTGDDEFGKLHAAVRIILPLLPALCASSPMLDGKLLDCIDGRMMYYRDNQKQIPSVTGQVVPEAVFSQKDYDKHIYQQISKDIALFNKDDLLDPVWVNSRGAMARFDRGSIEIRVMDIQECPAADIAIQVFVIEILRRMVSETWCSYRQQKSISTESLAMILNETTQRGMNAKITDEQYLVLFDIRKPVTANEMLQWFYSRLLTNETPIYRWKKFIDTILLEGNLSTRIRKALRNDTSVGSIRQTWKRLADCLHNDTMFIP